MSTGATSDLERDLKRVFARPDLGLCDRTRELALWSVNELEEPQRSEFERHLRGCSDCLENLRELDALGEAEAPPERSSWLSRLWPRPRVLAPLLAAGAACVLCVALWSQHPSESPLHAKGGWQLLVAVERDGRVFRASHGAMLQAGDRLGFFYTSEASGYLALFSADEAGTVLRLYPSGQKPSAAVAAGREVRIPDGAVLSAGHGFEWLVGFFSPKPILETEAASALRRMVASRKGFDLGAAGLKNVETRVIGVRR